MKYTDSGGRVEFLEQKISDENDKNGVRFIVRDNGRGMSEEFLKEIFELFSQERMKNDTNEQSSGLGLAIAKRLVEAMGGTIRVSSKIGEGTEFVVELYACINVKSEERSSRIVKEYPCLQGIHILLVEDNEINTLVAMKLLEKVGCIIDTAENGMEAVKKFSTSENGYYDVILMDVRMPILNGIEATKKIRMLDRKDAAIVQIIAMTADAFTNDQDMTQEAGMNAHITKPIEADIMYDTIAQRLIRR